MTRRSRTGHLVSLSFVTGALVLYLALISPTPAAHAAEESRAVSTVLTTAMDSEVARAVEMELLSSRAVPAHRIDVLVRQGVVTLSGTVENLLAARKAVEHTSAVRGVLSVVDRLQVTSSGKSDSHISRAIQRSLLYDPATESFEIEAAVIGGIVKLEGKVQSWAEKTLVEEVVAGVDGVVRVENDIQVVFPESRSEAEILHDIGGLLASSVWIDERSVLARVEGKNVTLQGTVRSQLEKELCERTAWVSGVESVDSSKLVVRPGPREVRHRDQRFVEVDDRQSEALVMVALSHDPRVKSFDVRVESKKGTVTLTGVVNNLAAKYAAAKTAMNTVGVWRVKNYLRVRSDFAPSDTVIEARIESALARSAFLGQHEFAVHVRNGHVAIFGIVNSRFERDRAEKLAAAAAGVVAVENYLKVRGRDADFDDRSIREDIREHIKWNPYVEVDGIVVDVVDGVATLSGNVNNLFERREAVREAREGGAVRVVNRLTVIAPTFGSQPKQ